MRTARLAKFKTSLDIDSALRVTYPAAKTFNRTAGQSNFAFLSKEKQSVSAQSQHITIRNSRPAPVSALRVLDHVPVSTDARIKVHVITPKGLDSTLADAPTLPITETTDNGPRRSRTRQRSWADVQVGEGALGATGRWW